jgi:hypothetical protein
MSRKRVLYEKSLVVPLVKKFPAFNETQRFILFLQGSVIFIYFGYYFRYETVSDQVPQRSKNIVHIFRQM